MTVNETIKLVCNSLGISWNPSEISQRGIILKYADFPFPCLCQNIFDKTTETDLADVVEIDFYMIVDKGQTDDVEETMNRLSLAYDFTEQFMDSLSAYYTVNLVGQKIKSADLLDCMEAGIIFTLQITYYDEC